MAVVDAWGETLYIQSENVEEEMIRMIPSTHNIVSKMSKDRRKRRKIAPKNRHKYIYYIQI